jgi:hypothetical protein
MREDLRRDPEMARDPEDLGHDSIGHFAYERHVLEQQLSPDCLDEAR